MNAHPTPAATARQRWRAVRVSSVPTHDRVSQGLGPGGAVIRVNGQPHPPLARDWRTGQPGWRRQVQQHAARRGYDLSAQRARRLVARDFEEFDLVLVMDAANEAHARPLCPPGQHHRLLRLTDFCTTVQAYEVPDPYYGGAAGFEQVLDIVEDACRGLLGVLAPATGSRP